MIFPKIHREFTLFSLNVFFSFRGFDENVIVLCILVAYEEENEIEIIISSIRNLLELEFISQKVIWNGGSWKDKFLVYEISKSWIVEFCRLFFFLSLVHETTEVNLFWFRAKKFRKITELNKKTNYLEKHETGSAKFMRKRGRKFTEFNFDVDPELRSVTEKESIRETLSKIFICFVYYR